MTKRYKFGFPSRPRKISFPGRPRIITVEVSCNTPVSGDFGHNGEHFGLTAPYPVGPSGPIGSNSVILIPGSAQLPTFHKPPNSPPAIVNPFSKDMTNRLYAWEQPAHGFINPSQTSAAAVAFLEIDNVTVALKQPKTFQFFVNTASHGTGTPPPPPSLVWFWYADPLNLDLGSAAVVSATENIVTQSFLDITINQSSMQYNILDRTVAASPFSVADFGSIASGFCSMYSYFGPTIGYIPVNYPNGFTTQAEALSWMNYFIDGGDAPDPAYPPGGGGANPNAIGIFPWAVSPPPYPGQSACNWTVLVRSWRRANSFPVSQGALGRVKIIVAKQSVTAASIQMATIQSPGANARACTITVTVNPASMKFTQSTKFS